MQPNPYIYPSDLPDLDLDLSVTSTIQAADHLVEVGKSAYVYCTCTMRWKVCCSYGLAALEAPVAHEPYRMTFKLASWVITRPWLRHPLHYDFPMVANLVSIVALALCPHCLTLYWFRVE